MTRFLPRTSFTPSGTRHIGIRSGRERRQPETQQRPLLEGSYRHLDRIIVTSLQGREDAEPLVRAILDSRTTNQVKAVLVKKGERYRRLNRARFSDLLERLRLRGVPW